MYKLFLDRHVMYISFDRSRSIEIMRTQVIKDTLPQVDL